MSIPSIKVFSVSEFVTSVSGYLEQGLGMVAVQGEVTGFNVNRGMFVFFELKDKKSHVKCFMMTRELRVPLEDGMEVRVMGTAKLFQKNGGFHVRVVQVEHVGEGALKRAYELLKQKLEAEGLFAPERKRALPRFPEHIGVVTSEDAAAWTDVKRVLANRWPLARVTLAHVGVQGQGAVREIVGGIRWMNNPTPALPLAGEGARRTAPEVIILTRGGGSLEDLQAFNSEDVCRAVFASSIPVISGVGHERDVTLVDFVTDVRAATPSNAAELVTPDRVSVLSHLIYFQSRLANAVESEVKSKQQTLHGHIGTLHRSLRNMVDVPRQRLNEFSRRLLRGMSSQLLSLKKVIHTHERLIHHLSPQATLARGYTITMIGDTVIKSVRGIRKGDAITTTFIDGAVKSKIEVVEQ